MRLLAWWVGEKGRWVQIWILGWVQKKQGWVPKNSSGSNIVWKLSELVWIPKIKWPSEYQKPSLKNISLCCIQNSVVHCADAPHPSYWNRFADAPNFTYRRHHIYYIQCLTSSSCKYLAAQMFARRSNQVARGWRSTQQDVSTCK
jgi:hypothetical protein